MVTFDELGVSGQRAKCNIHILAVQCLCNMSISIGEGHPNHISASEGHLLKAETHVLTEDVLRSAGSMAA